jgi:hypothetical protein
MELETIVKYGSGRACFKIRREDAGIYYASLVYFEGDKKTRPPQEITLIRGIRQWTGSHDSTELLNQLGKSIEDLYNRSLASSKKIIQID